MVILGETAHQEGELARSLEYWQQARRVAQQIPSLGRETHALVGLGRLYIALGQREKAHTAFQEGIRLNRTLESKLEKAVFLQDCGYSLSLLGEPAEALVALEEAEQLWREQGNAKGIADTLDLKSHVCRRSNQLQKALDAALASLHLYQELKEGLKAMIALNKIALMYQDLGDPQKAIAYLNQTLQQGESQHDTRILGETLSHLGLIYQGLGELGKALEYSQGAARARRQDGTPLALAWELGRQASLHAELKQPEKGLKCLEEALQISRTTKNPKFEAELTPAVGQLYERLKQPQKAREWYEKALRLQREAGVPEAEVFTLQNLGELSISRPEIARSYFLQAQKLYQTQANRIGEAGVLTRLGHLAYQQGHRTAAEKSYQQALSLVEQLRRDAGNGTSAQGTFFESLRDPYLGYLTLLLGQGRTTEAFTLAQKTKARGLLDLMAGGKIDLSAQLTDAERAQEQQKRAQCEQLSTIMVQEAARNEVGSKKRFEARKAELAVAERELALFQDQLYAKYPSLQQRRVAKIASLDQIAKALPTDAALLEFAPLDGNRTVLFVLTRDRTGKPTVTAHKVPHSLEQPMRALREACTNPKKPWKAEASRLYQALLAPIEARLLGKAQLVVCPDRSLWDVPFAVLLDKHQTPLLSRFALSYASSAATWHAAQSVPRKASGSSKLLVLANPQFDAEKRFENGPTVPGQRPITVPGQRPITVPDRPITVPDRDLFVPRATRLVDLPGTQREADALAKRFPHAVIYTRSKAQESVVKNTARQFQRIHLASHAFVNDAAPLLSSIVLANPTPCSGDDGFLTAREIFELDLSGVELVVLSACNTARGQKQGGEGVVGLTWALFAAGCPTQVLSQWAVDDASTATLMNQFYAGMGKGQSKASALRSAALQLRQSQRYTHPYYWAPFVLIGDPR
ncbi:CHAT domain-containing protein [Armatimonas sp.]|uniref:CHAT domain-containing tetratricopeptide repeat protein n=1 Tax=Armatimonas sp. TaxID=1872638 RepID=UPI0037538156